MRSIYFYILLFDFSNCRFFNFAIWYSKINSSIAIEFFIIFFYLTARSLLNWRALNTPIRTINTTISFFRFKFIFAIRTLPNILTIISRHLFGSLLMTLRTRNCWLELNVSHILNPETRIEIIFSSKTFFKFTNYKSIENHIYNYKTYS